LHSLIDRCNFKQSHGSVHFVSDLIDMGQSSQICFQTSQADGVLKHSIIGTVKLHQLRIIYPS